MKFPVRAKLILCFLLFTAVGVGALALFGGVFLRQQYLTARVRRLYKDANYISESYKVNGGSLQQNLLESMAYVSESEIWILSTDGTVTAWSGNEAHPEKVPGFDPAAGINGYYMTGDFYQTLKNDSISVYKPLSTAIQPQGYVVLHSPMSGILESADEALRFSYIILAVLLAAAVLLLVLLDFILVRPLKKTEQAALEYAHGNLSYPNPVKTRDEVGIIALTQEDLARQLSSSAEDQRRLLANISHDFRSPLTSIRGYMAAIQDGTIPPELQGKYIDVVISETNRLTNLSNGLLDMAQLESGIILDRTNFDINDLIREVLGTFEGRMAEKDMVFRVTFEQTSQYVNVDRSRIEQVLYNLVDNAIKFSGERSSIDLSTYLERDKVFVSVRDHGAGIAKEHLGKIWNRFYKTDASRGRDKKSTGLGLAIVREIIQAHRENIDVISTVGVGTEFIFTLTES